ncbi:MAG: hypothetical protein ABI831_08445 [Betaproteobacteria bacterium]
MNEPGQSSVIDVTPSGTIGPPAGLVNVGHAIYACYAVGFFVGVTWLVAIILAYVKRDEAQGTWMESHFSWQIRTFWWSLLWCVLGWVLFVTLVGMIVAFPMWAVAWLWALYRVIKGWMRLNDAKPVS